MQFWAYLSAAAEEEEEEGACGYVLLPEKQQAGFLFKDKLYM
jgi:hypothetical protein